MGAGEFIALSAPEETVREQLQSKIDKLKQVVQDMAIAAHNNYHVHDESNHALHWNDNCKTRICTLAREVLKTK